MATKNKKISLIDFPEEVSESCNMNVKVYGETSYENQMAVLSHYLHNHRKDIGNEEQMEIVYAIRDFLSRKEILQKVDISEWSDEQVLMAAEDPAQYGLFSEFFNIPFPSPHNPKFTFIDLFAGVGGIRLGMQEAGGKCIYSSEWNCQAQKTYLTNYGEMPFGDITKESTKNYIPDNFDVLCAGFPCQPFSISGKQKGFEDTRGTLFFDICSIVSSKRPKVVFLENVKHLVHHDEGNTLKTILNKLKVLGYNVTWQVLNGSDYGVPQNRERIIIVGSIEGEFDFTKVKKKPRTHLIDFLDKDGDFEYLAPEEYTLLDNPKEQPESGLIFAGYRNKSIRKAGVRPGTEHLSRVHKQPNRIYSVYGIHPTLPSQESSGRFFVLTEDHRVRKLTIDECWRIMGFPEKYKKVSPVGDQYKQLGNSVCIPMIEAVADEINNQFFSNR
ncbi:MAG: DNA cytosine methyltransferase [Bacteroidales bacterium]|nr:DNA cytosine methyltransferase [Bacteroidales bacterium]